MRNNGAQRDHQSRVSTGLDQAAQLKRRTRGSAGAGKNLPVGNEPARD